MRGRSGVGRGVRTVEEAGNAVSGSGLMKGDRRLLHTGHSLGRRRQRGGGDRGRRSGRPLGKVHRHRRPRRNEPGTGVRGSSWRSCGEVDGRGGCPEQWRRMMLLLHHGRVQDDADHDRREARRADDQGKMRPHPTQPRAQRLAAVACARRPGPDSALGWAGVDSGHAAESGFTQLCGPSKRGQGAAAPSSDDDAKWFLFSQQRREPRPCGSRAATGRTPRCPRRARWPA